MSHIWMSHVTHMNESCHTYEWVMSHIWMSHVTHTNESCHTYDWVMSHIWIIHATCSHTHLDAHYYYYTFVWWMSHIPYEWAASHVPRFMRLSHVPHEPRTEEISHNMSHYMWHDSFIWDMTHSHESCNSDMAHSSWRRSVFKYLPCQWLRLPTTKFSDKFSRESLYTLNTVSWESPKFQASFHGSNWSPHHPRDLSGKLMDLEIQIL